MSVELMREAIKKVYPGEKWQKRVSKMKDAQVIAIYNKMLNNNKLK
jgi:hypothetical protein